MNLNRTRRFQIALALFMIFALYNVISTARQIGVTSPLNVGHDRISDYVHRFDSLRDTLRCYRKASYVDDGTYNAAWFQAQYALAPTVLVQGCNEPLVVANFHVDSSESKTRVEEQLKLIRDYGHGVRLYEGKAP